MSAEKDILDGLNDVMAYVNGTKQPARVTRVVPAEVDVLAIREGLRLSQQEFAKRYGFPVGTVRNWEQRRRTPEGAARLLLKLIESRPDVVDGLASTGS